MKKLFLIFLALIPLIIMAQEEKKFGIKFGGFVKTDIFFDSRQTVDARYGQFMLYPKNEELDVNGDDINASSKFNIMSIQTRLRGVITGPDALGAKTSGLIEGAFFGNIASDVNGFRLRHAFVKLSWSSAELLVGQYWHPMFVTSCFPGTVSFNTGTPFQPFARNPQIRFTKRFGKVNLIGTLIEQIDFADSGPNGTSPIYLINSGIPELNLRLEYKSDNLILGAGIDYKSLKPRLSLTNSSSSFPDAPTFKTDSKANSTSIFGYFKYKAEPITIKLYGVSGQSMFGMTNLGGYAETGYQTTQLDGEEVVSDIDYSPTKTNSFWADIHTNGATWQLGLFGGFSKNAGANDTIMGTNYSRGANIDYLYRISPRLIYNNGKFRVAPEIEYTVAAYATRDEESGAINIDAKGKVEKSSEVGNFRFLIGVYYFF